MNTVSISEVKNDFSGYLERSANEDVIVTNHGKPVAVIHGFADEEEYFEYRLLNDPRFLKIVEKAREEIKEGRTTRIEDLEIDDPQ